MRLREQERRNKKVTKKKKKHKRGKKGRGDSESDEEDIPVLQSVSSAFDLPEVIMFSMLLQQIYLTNCY